LVSSSASSHSAGLGSGWGAPVPFAAPTSFAAGGLDGTAEAGIASAASGRSHIGLEKVSDLKTMSRPPGTFPTAFALAAFHEAGQSRARSA
jgi:hypothetical protein